LRRPEERGSNKEKGGSIGLEGLWLKGVRGNCLVGGLGRADTKNELGQTGRNGYSGRVQRKNAFGVTTKADKSTVSQKTRKSLGA